jgi:hypothetical protein
LLQMWPAWRRHIEDRLDFVRANPGRHSGSAAEPRPYPTRHGRADGSGPVEYSEYPQCAAAYPKPYPTRRGHAIRRFASWRFCRRAIRRTICHHVAPYVTMLPHMSPWLHHVTMLHHMSPCCSICHHAAPYVTICHHVAPYDAPCCTIYVAPCCTMLHHMLHHVAPQCYTAMLHH